MAGIYVHIPFCKSRCIYCGFYSTTSTQLASSYVDAIMRELELRRNYLKNEPIETIYLGGGTPSTLPHSDLIRLTKALVEYAGTDHLREFTIECNPDDITPEFATLLYNIGINRVSMGVQTFSDERLRFLGRRHDSSSPIKAMEMLHQAGISNISLDLMFGFPNQTLEEWITDVYTIIKLHPEHISAYSLMYEEGTRLFRLLEQGKVNEISDELSREMYYILIDMLHEAGYEQYEISNFSLPNRHSIHNSNYWNATPYLGLGAAAHSYNGFSRCWNVSDVKQYIKSINSDTLPLEMEHLDTTTRYNDLITTAMRTKHGISLKDVENLFGEIYYQHLLKNAQPMINSGLLKIHNEQISLTRQALYISDDVMCELIYA